MKKFKLNSACLLGSLKEHQDIKDTLINKLQKADCNYLEDKTDYVDNLIHKLDWANSQDELRDWVKYIKPYLKKYFKDCANTLGYHDVLIKNIWFQQYNKNGKHDWHVHGENYTGVYYVKFFKNSAKTELIDPFSQDKKLSIDAKEGDIVLFPSYVIHRASEQQDEFEKIIISFNLEFIDIKIDLIKKINVLKEEAI